MDETGFTPLVTEKMGDYLLVVVSNRQPYAHIFKKESLNVSVRLAELLPPLTPLCRPATESG